MKDKLRNFINELQEENNNIDKKLQDDKKPVSERNHTILVHTYNKNLDVMKRLKEILLTDE